MELKQALLFLIKLQKQAAEKLSNSLCLHKAATKLMFSTIKATDPNKLCSSGSVCFILTQEQEAKAKPVFHFRTALSHVCSWQLDDCLTQQNASPYEYEETVHFFPFRVVLPCKYSFAFSSKRKKQSRSAVHLNM